MKKSIALKKPIVFIALAALALTSSVMLAAESGEEGFVPLFNGRDLTGWKLRRADAHNSWSIARSGANVVVTFEGTLQAAGVVTGTYTNVLNATSPYTNAPTATTFFRSTR
jgi:hypothetical protein